MTRSFTINGIDHIIRMLNQYPQMNSLSSLAPVFEIGRKAKEAVKRSGCGCSAGPIYNANKAIFDQALTNMGNGDHLIVKSLLNVDQLCYYVTDAHNRRTLKCI